MLFPCLFRNNNIVTQKFYLKKKTDQILELCSINPSNNAYAKEQNPLNFPRPRDVLKYKNRKNRNSLRNEKD